MQQFIAHDETVHDFEPDMVGVHVAGFFQAECVHSSAGLQHGSFQDSSNRAGSETGTPI